MAEQQQWVCGLHAVEELLRQRPAQVEELVFQSGRQDRRANALREQAAARSIPATTVPRRELDKRLAEAGTAGARHQGVAARCRLPSVVRDEAFLQSLLDGMEQAPLLLVLDGITDPHNLGACLRSADAAGVDAVITPRDRCAPVNLTVRKVASGAAESVNIVAVTNLARTLGMLQQRGIWICGAAGQGTQSLYETDLRGPSAVVMGSEGKGLRRLTREHCDFLVTLPMAGRVASLNVSVATGICLYEAVRQRHYGSR